MMMGKALIKKTGEVFDIKEIKMKMDFSYPFKKNPSSSKSIIGYTLSNGESYNVDLLIIGEDNIRDWKIKNIIE